MGLDVIADDVKFELDCPCVFTLALLHLFFFLGFVFNMLYNYIFTQGRIKIMNFCLCHVHISLHSEM